jgi:hypothetical protein
MPSHLQRCSYYNKKVHLLAVLVQQVVKVIRELFTEERNVGLRSNDLIVALYLPRVNLPSSRPPNCLFASTSRSPLLPMVCWSASSCHFSSLVASVVAEGSLSFPPLLLRKGHTGGPVPSIVHLVFENLAPWYHSPCTSLSGRTHDSGRLFLHHRLSPSHQYSVGSRISANSCDHHR